jgi:alpha-glucuronidase
MRFLGDTMRRSGLEKIIEGAVEEKRRRWRPTTARYDDIKNWTGLNMAAASALAHDRTKWQELVRTTTALFVPSH